MSDAARAKVDEWILSEYGEQLAGNFLPETLDGIAGLMDAFAAEQTAALWAVADQAISRLFKYGFQTDAKELDALLADAGQAGEEWKIERCPVCRHDAPHVGCVTATLEVLAVERARQR